MKNQTRQGVVYLVGAGPGDPDLVTVKAMRLLSECDVVVYDNLIPDELIATLPPGIERRYVGKQANRHSLPQENINQMLVDLAAQGKRVVRLKGGDPFVFGRGGEEAEYLKKNGVRYEIVPGVTAGVAVPAFAGIPCTDRTKASYVIFATGHKAVGKDSPGVPWEWVAGAINGTLIIYMGVSEAREIVEKLTRAGMPGDLPAAAIERGTTPTQRVVTSTLSDLPSKIADAELKPPAILVVGNVVDFRDTLGWFEDKPLHGVRIMVTRPADQAETTYRALRELGAEVLPCPTIATAEDYRPGDWDALGAAAAEKRWLVFTSENGVRYFLARWYAANGDIRGLAAYQIAAIGVGTARALKHHRLLPDFVPTTATTDALAQEMSAELDLSGALVVRVRGNLGDDTVERTLEAAGAMVLPVHVYQTFSAKWPAETKEKLLNRPPDAIVFTSGSSVDGFVENLDTGELKKLTANACVVSIGTSTSKAIHAHGMTVGLESKLHTIPDIIDTLVAHYSSIDSGA